MRHQVESGKRREDCWIGQPNRLSNLRGIPRFARNDGVHDLFPQLVKPRALLLLHKKFRKLFVKMLHFRNVVDHDVQVVGMMVGVILVIVFRGIERV
jgi:hypothetical protein